MTDTKPWLSFYGDVSPSLTYPEVTLYDRLLESVARFPDAVAYDFLGTRCTYRDLAADIERCADALASLGLGQGDRLLIAMPTCPQGIVAVYAANRIGAVAAMVHPLSTVGELQGYLQASQAKVALTLDAFYGKLAAARDGTALQTLVLARIPDYLPPLTRLGFRLTKGRKIAPVPADPMVRWWKSLLAGSHPRAPKPEVGTHELAVILFSGGTTGKPKGIMLSSLNFIAEGMQVAAWGKVSSGDSMLAILPIFHGFGLGVCVNAVFMGGGKSILVPQFTPELVAKLVRQKRPSLLVGVPTLFDALSRSEVFAKADLSCLKATFSGADTLPRTVKERFETVVKRAGGDVQLMEGYGLTEAVTAIMATPLGHYREGSIGVPFPDMLAKVVTLGTTEVAPIGAEGELCIHGPAVMLGYLDAPAETAEALREHADGRRWLHTGDIATMDADGFFYFRLRQKRMIKSSGFNVYPAQVEAVLYRHPEVVEACVIGVPDESQGRRIRAVVVVRDPAREGPELERELIALCQKELIKWSCPREVEFRRELPKTLIGKVAYRVLEEGSETTLRRP
jgi:long-chain acyl-CoA synthetase